MQIIVETTGDFQIMGKTPEMLVPWNRPKLVHKGAHHSYLQRGMLRLVGQVSDEVTDEDLVEWLKADMSVEDFIAANPTTGEKPPVKSTKRRQSTAE